MKYSDDPVVVAVDAQGVKKAAREAQIQDFCEANGLVARPIKGAGEMVDCPLQGSVGIHWTNRGCVGCDACARKITGYILCAVG